MSATPGSEMSVDLHDDGLLWLINRVVFHPRGFALALNSPSGSFSLLGDGSEPWTFGSDLDEKALLVAAEECFARAAHRGKEKE